MNKYGFLVHTMSLETVTATVNADSLETAWERLYKGDFMEQDVTEQEFTMNCSDEGIGGNFSLLPPSFAEEQDGVYLFDLHTATFETRQIEIEADSREAALEQLRSIEDPELDSLFEDGGFEYEYVDNYTPETITEGYYLPAPGLAWVKEDK